LAGTHGPCSRAPPSSSFQYPRTDRLGWNNGHDQAMMIAIALSVSSNGSTWLEHENKQLAITLNRLSVSSNGSTWLEPRARWRRRGASCNFQYPRTDRLGWNQFERVSASLPVGLSVSSNGSTWLERGRRRWDRHVESPFSILERIDLAGTHSTGVGARLHWLFQYPRTDRLGWNSSRRCGARV